MNKSKKLLSQRHPALYFLCVWGRRLERHLRDLAPSRGPYASTYEETKLPHRVKKHQSVLLRTLGETEMWLQHNKVKNLALALPHLDNLLIRPGETFSFCRLVGRPTRRRGFLPGMELSFGRARPGIGGGLCQIANLIHWLVIHSPLTVVERHHHSFDPFPDEGRVLPFGSGATVFYNYRDYRFKNETPHTYQLRLWLSAKCLEGELRTEALLPQVYHVVEKRHAFLKVGPDYFRRNELWRNRSWKKGGGEILATELITRNFAKVMYAPPEYEEVAPEDLEPWERAGLL